MKPRLLAAGALAVALLVTGTPLKAGAASAAPLPAKTAIMLAGDSITEGIDGDYTWRYRLDQELRRQHLDDLVDLVGPRTAPRGSYRHYLGGQGWDSDHDSVSGTTLNYQMNLIGPQIETYQPDILVSFLGTNDFLDVARNNAGLSAEDLLPLYQERIDRVLNDWQTYIDAVRAAGPTTKIVLGELITPRVPQTVRDDYNARLASLAQTTWFALGSPIEVAQLAGNIWSSSRYLYDTIHPAPTGETYLAQRFAEAIHAVDAGVFPEPIQIQRANVLWDPVLRPRFAVRGQRIIAYYGYTARYSSATGMRVRLASPRFRKTRQTSFRKLSTATTWTSHQLRPGTYRIRLQANRALMRSTWSQVYTVKITKPGKPSRH